jgi:energy-converting hydrogenase Eha subunit A
MGKSKALLLVLIFLIASCAVTIKPARASENSWLTRPPMLESAGMGVAVDGKIYAIGAITQEYDPVALTWTKKASTPNSIGGSVAVYQNKIYVISDSQNQVYDIATDT